MDHVDHILGQWQVERPDLDTSPMAVIGRLARAAASVEAALAANFTRHDIDASTFDVLATLLRQGPPYELAPAGLAQEAMITSSAVAQRLNRLDELGLIRRLPHPDDRRGKRVQLTARGKEIVERVLPDHLATEQEALAHLNLDERASLARLLGRLSGAGGSSSNGPDI